MLLAATLMGTAVAHTAQALEGNYSKKEKRNCRFRQNHRYSERESYDSVTCAFRAIAPGKLDLARRIIRRESRWKTYARNDSSSAGGLLQYLSGTWHSVCKHFRPVRRRWDIHRCNRFNARHSALLGATHMKRWGTSAWSLTGG